MKRGMSMKRLFIDMDGTLACFYEDAKCLENMWEPGFFLNLKPYPNIIEAIHLFIYYHPDVEVGIASSVITSPYCKEEKDHWIDLYLPEIKRENRFFPPVGKSKASVLNHITKEDYLLDDYNNGLDLFIKDGGSAIKFKNDINHLGKVGSLWQGDLIDYEQPPYAIVKELEKIMEI